MTKHTLIVLLSVFLFAGSQAQTPYISESLIKYDLTTHTATPTIPFDKAFTLMIDKFPGGDRVIEVHIYEAHKKDGHRLLVYNIFPTASGTYKGKCQTYNSLPHGHDSTAKKDTAAIKDMTLNFKGDTGSLAIFVNPLKPNKLFDFNIISRLSAENKAILYTVNALLQQGKDQEAFKAYGKLANALTDKFIHRTYLNLDTNQYKTFYTNKLAAFYDYAANNANFSTEPFLLLQDVQAVAEASMQDHNDFKDAHYLVEAIKNNNGDGIQLGLVNLSKVYQPSDITEAAYGNTRLVYLQSNLKFFDSLQQKTGSLISKGYTNIAINGSNISLADVRDRVKAIRQKMVTNIENLKKQMDDASTAIDANDDILEGTYLVGQTISSDLKTAGGNVLFLDAGFTNIIAPDIGGKHIIIPRLYTGVSIYFRPIDKNTRRNAFPKKFDDKNCGCAGDTCGPDYGVITKATIWQHLCLNVGITWGAMPNQNFDNLYNNSSLLVGPAYRFKRAFKISAGLSVLKRVSENPVKSEKEVITGKYISMSVDIDFIQSIKDLTSKFF